MTMIASAIATGRCIITPPFLQPNSNPIRSHQFPVGPLSLGLGYSCKPLTSSKRATMRANKPGQNDQVSTHQEDAMRKYLEVYDTLKSELLQDPAFEFTDDSRRWIHEMLDYNVRFGKPISLSVIIRSYQLLHPGKKLSDEDYFLACVLAWCVKMNSAGVLLTDDILDNSYTRWGRPCWFRLPQVGTMATNDAMLLQAQIFRILKKHFGEKPYYVQLLDLFHEITFRTSCGQMLDAITSREKNLSNYSMELYRRIVKYKATYFLMYLPGVCALILAGERPEDHFEFEDIFVEIATYFQIQNDYLDCYGDLKVGTDIEDGSCSWLILKALEHSNEEQMRILYENYGKVDPTCVAKVKEIYASLDIQNMGKQYERETFEELKKSVEAHPSKVVQAIYETFVECFPRMRT